MKKRTKALILLSFWPVTIGLYLITRENGPSETVHVYKPALDSNFERIDTSNNDSAESERKYPDSYLNSQVQEKLDKRKPVASGYANRKDHDSGGVLEEGAVYRSLESEFLYQMEASEIQLEAGLYLLNLMQKNLERDNPLQLNEMIDRAGSQFSLSIKQKQELRSILDKAMEQSAQKVDIVEALSCLETHYSKSRVDSCSDPIFDKLLDRVDKAAKYGRVSSKDVLIDDEDLRYLVNECSLSLEKALEVLSLHPSCL